MEPFSLWSTIIVCLTQILCTFYQVWHSHPSDKDNPPRTQTRAPKLQRQDAIKAIFKRKNLVRSTWIMTQFACFVLVLYYSGATPGKAILTMILLTIVVILPGIIIIVPAVVAKILRSVEMALERKTSRSILIVESVFLSAFVLVLLQESHTRDNSYGPPVVFAPKAHNFRVMPLQNQSKILQAIVTEGYRVTLVNRRNSTRIDNGILIPLKSTIKDQGMISAYKQLPFQDSSKILIPIASIAKLEFKKTQYDSLMKPVSSLWAIERIDSTSLTPQTSLYAVHWEEFALARQSFPDDSFYTEIEDREASEIRIFGLAAINGIEVTPQFESSDSDDVGESKIIWLLGYDGSLYKAEANDTSLVSKLGPNNSSPVTIEMETVGSLADVSQRHVAGWQSLDLIESPQSLRLGAATEFTFLVTNSELDSFFVFQVKPSYQNSKESIACVGTAVIPNPSGTLRRDEGSASFRLDSANTQLLCYSDAFSGVISVGYDWSFSRGQDTVLFKDLIPKSLESLTLPSFPRTYVEGLAFSQCENPTLYASDRSGTIFYRPHFRLAIDNRSYDNLITLLSAPNRVFGPDNSWWYVLDLSGAVTHGQDIACDQNEDVWFAEENYFRKIDDKIFSWRYGWECWLRENAISILCFLSMGAVVTVVGSTTRQRLQ